MEENRNTTATDMPDPEMPDIPQEQPDIPEPEPVRKERGHQIERAAGSPAVAVILAILGLVFAAAGAFGGFWLIAGIIGTGLCAASVIFAWKIEDKSKTATAVLALSVTAVSIAGFSLVTSGLATVQDLLEPEIIYYDDDAPFNYGGYGSRGFDDFGMFGLDEYEDYFGSSDEDSYWN